MPRHMFPVEVYVSDAGYVCMRQNYAGNDENISLDPSQIDTLCEWLKRAKQEATDLQDIIEAQDHS